MAGPGGHGRLHALHKTAASAAALEEPARTTVTMPCSLRSFASPAVHNINTNCNIIISEPPDGWVNQYEGDRIQSKDKGYNEKCIQI